MKRAVKHRDFGVTTRARARPRDPRGGVAGAHPCVSVPRSGVRLVEPGAPGRAGSRWAIIAVRHDVPLPSGIAFDATVALALIAVALVGPLRRVRGDLPADRGQRAVRPRTAAARRQPGQPRRLRLVHARGRARARPPRTSSRARPPPSSRSCATGCVLLVVNFAVGPLIYATMWLGHPLRSVARMFPDGLPAGVAMTTLGALTVVLYAARRAARPRHLRPRRRAAAERAHVRGPHAARSGSSTRSPPRAATRTRCACSSTSAAPSAGSSTTSSAPRTRAASRATRPSTSATRSWTGARRPAPPGT